MCMIGTKMGTVGGKFLCERQWLLRLPGAALPVSEAPACLLHLQTVDVTEVSLFCNIILGILLIEVSERGGGISQVEKLKPRAEK